VLATTVALAPPSPFKNDLVYYLNLQDDDTEDADGRDAEPARPDVLFIIDNVHLNGDIATRPSCPMARSRRWQPSSDARA